MCLRRSSSGDRGKVGADVGPEHPEVLEAGRDRRHRLGLAGRPLAFQVGDRRPTDRRPQPRSAGANRTGQPALDSSSTTPMWNDTRWTLLTAAR